MNLLGDVDEADAIECGSYFINLDPYIHSEYLHVRIGCVQFYN